MKRLLGLMGLLCANPVLAQETTPSTEQSFESASVDGAEGEAASESKPDAGSDEQADLSEYDAPDRRSLVLHAEAISAENRGAYDEALEQLRAAYALTPDSDRVRFDLARVALLHGGEHADLRPYSASSPPDDPGAAVLHAAVRKELETKTEVTDGERMFRGSVRLGITYDDNVAIAPNDTDPFESPAGTPPPTLTIAEPQTGVRGVLDALVTARPLDDKFLTVQGMAGLRVGTFLNSDDGTTLGDDTATVTSADLATFDAQRLYLGGTVQSELAGFVLRGALTGSAVFTDGFSTNFSQSLTLGAEALYGGTRDYVGLYGDVAAYNFGEQANPEDTEFDRDGTTTGAGLTLGVNRGGLLGFTARLGAFNESTDGEDLQVRGARLDVAFVSQAGPVSVVLGSGLQGRIYGDVSITEINEDTVNARVDGLIQPFLRVLVAITDNVGVYGNYGYTQNVSTDSENLVPAGGGRQILDRTYTRNFFELGVEGRL